MKRKTAVILSVLLLISCSPKKEQEQAVNQVRPTDVAVTKVVLQDFRILQTTIHCQALWKHGTILLFRQKHLDLLHG